MSNIKCPNCGNVLPQGSAFCNKCGCRLDSDGGRYNNDYDDWHNDNQSRNNRSSNKTKYVLIAIGVIAFLAIVFISKKYYGNNERNNEIQPVSIVDNSNSAAADALQRALNDNNYVGDGASIVYAMRIPGTEPGTNDKIIGITQLSGKGDESFYKLYELVQNGEKWSIDPDHIKQVPTNGRDITFDQNKLKAGVDMIPQVREIDGRKYFFYAFLSIPMGDTSNRGSVVLNLYDIESRNITSATYEGTFQNVNGEQAIVCKPASGSSEVVKWMNEQARNFIRILSISDSDQEEKKDSRTEEALPTQEPKPAATTQEKAVTATEANKESTASSTIENVATPSSAANVGEEKDKDSPMFSKDEIVETKQAGNYKVFRLKDGSVVRYDRSTGKNTKIHQGGAEAIGFEDTEKGILNIRKADGTREQVNLNNGQKTQSPPKTQTPATPGTSKTE